MGRSPGAQGQDQWLDQSNPHSRVQTTRIRHEENTCTLLLVSQQKQFSGRKGDFLSREKNKSDMIALISTELTKRGCHVIRSPGDADVDIVKTTVERSRYCTTTLVGEDTDLLILLLH